jgi:hypothetical protein
LPIYEYQRQEYAIILTLVQVLQLVEVELLLVQAVCSAVRLSGVRIARSPFYVRENDKNADDQHGIPT